MLKVKGGNNMSLNILERNLFNNDLVTDIIDNETNYEMFINVPGYSKDEIVVSFDNNILEIDATKKENKNLNELESKKYLIKERNDKKAVRRFYFGSSGILNHVNPDEINVELINGQLRIILNKKNRKSIEIK